MQETHTHNNNSPSDIALFWSVLRTELDLWEHILINASLPVLHQFTYFFPSTSLYHMSYIGHLSLSMMYGPKMHDVWTICWLKRTETAGLFCCCKTKTLHSVMSYVTEIFNSQIKMYHDWFTLMSFRTHMTFFLLCYTKGDHLMNFHLGEFRTMALRRDSLMWLIKCPNNVNKISVHWSFPKCSG